jgi:hypothetical protein
MLVWLPKLDEFVSNNIFDTAYNLRNLPYSLRK